MKIIDLEAIIKSIDLDREGVANELFPNNKYPMHSLKRVLKGKMELDAKQIVSLAKLANVNIERLFKNEYWKSFSNDNFETLVFTKGPYRAELILGSFITTLYHDGSLLEKNAILHNGHALSIGDYIDLLNLQIKKHEN